MSKKKVFIVGSPFIHYRKKNKIKRDLRPKGTVVFPNHSAVKKVSLYNIKKYCDQLNMLPEKFKPITICLHCDDITRNRERIYKKKGFNVVTAGHRYSKNFVKNFYNILKGKKFSTSNAIGTYVLYSVEMGIPFFLYGDEVDYYYLKGKGQYNIIKINKGKVRKTAELLFKVPLKRVEIDIQQKKFVENESGVNDHVDAEKLKKILLQNFYFKILPLAIVKFFLLPLKILKIILKDGKNVYNMFQSIKK